MAKRKSKSQPRWTEVKAKLAGFDRVALLGLIQSLYRAHKDNQTFLHARFGLAEDALEPYQKTLDRWLWPDLFRKQDTSVSQAKRAISDSKRAVGDPEGLAELMVFYCERAAGFCSDVCNDDEGYFEALVRMFEQALNHRCIVCTGRGIRQAIAISIKPHPYRDDGGAEGKRLFRIAQLEFAA